jgi:transposase
MSGSKRDVSRDDSVVKDYIDGITLREIADKHGISTQRASQIVKRNNVSCLDRKNYKTIKEREIAAKKKKEESLARRDSDCFIRTGYRLSEYEEIRRVWCRNGATPQDLFKKQKKNASSRRIEFKLNFRQWWELWLSSGKWGSRGVRVGQYVMGRKDDSGPYSIDNVMIQTSSSNISDGHKYRGNVLNKKS